MFAVTDMDAVINNSDVNGTFYDPSMQLVKFFSNPGHEHDDIGKPKYLNLFHQVFLAFQIMIAGVMGP